MMPKMGTGVMIVGAIILLVVGVGMWVIGIRTLPQLLTLLAVAIPVIAIIGLIVFGVWRLFIYKPRYDNLYMNKKKIIETARITKPKILKKIRLSGDRNHPGVEIGKIIGYTNDFDTEGNLLDVFVFKKSTLPIISWFEEPKAVYVYPADRSQLAGDITLYSLNLKQIGGLLFPIHYTYGDKMDIKIKEDVYRTFSFTMMSDLKEISDDSRGINAQHQQDLERKELLKVPVAQPQKSNEGY
jgi:hypothetical protein